MLFSAVAVNLNKVGFTFTTDQLFLLTALPSVSGAILRVPYSFVIPLFGGRRWTAISTCFLLVPCLWLGFAVQDSSTPYSVFVIISLLCGFAGANFASSMANISFFFPKARQGGALGLNGGLGKSGRQRYAAGRAAGDLFQPVRPVWRYGAKSGRGRPTVAGKRRLDLVPFLLVATLAAWFGMNDLAAAKASLRQQLPVLKRGHLWMLSLLYLATFGSLSVSPPASPCCRRRSSRTW